MTGLQPFNPMALVIIALLNPAVILVAFMMGRKANQWQKIVVAAFAAALAGFMLVFVATFLKVLPAKGLGGEAGLLALQFGFGLVWATIGYQLRKR